MSPLNWYNVLKQGGHYHFAVTGVLFALTYLLFRQGRGDTKAKTCGYKKLEIPYGEKISRTGAFYEINYSTS